MGQGRRRFGRYRLLRLAAGSQHKAGSKVTLLHIGEETLAIGNTITDRMMIRDDPGRRCASEMRFELPASYPIHNLPKPIRLRRYDSLSAT
jgi:hypothetical protein